MAATQLAGCTHSPAVILSPLGPPLAQRPRTIWVLTAMHPSTHGTFWTLYNVRPRDLVSWPTSVKEQA